MNQSRHELLIALQETEKRIAEHCIAVVESEKAKGNPVFYLYDPRNDKPVLPPCPQQRKRPGAIRHRNY